MKLSINTLCWTNSNPILKEYHSKVLSKFCYDVEYTHENIPHGMWMNKILNSKKADVYLFLDVDCVPMYPWVIQDTLEYVERGYMVGNAQVTNCINAKHDLFCAPSFLMISNDYYESLGKPNCNNNARSDVAQELTRSAVASSKRIKMYFPSSFQGVGPGGIWRLGPYGYYGLGTIFDESTFHMFNSRDNVSIEKFTSTCEKILSNKQNEIDRRFDSKLEYDGLLKIEDNY
jgi:hypothetical protein